MYFDTHPPHLHSKSSGNPPTQHPLSTSYFPFKKLYTESSYHCPYTWVWVPAIGHGQPIRDHISEENSAQLQFSPPFGSRHSVPPLLRYSLSLGEGVRYKCPICTWALHRHLSSSFWSVIRFCINLYQWIKYVSLCRTVKGTNLWVWRYVFRRQFVIMPI